MIALVAALGSMVGCTLVGNRIGKHYGHTAAGTGVGAIVGLFVGSAIGEALTPGKREEQGPALVSDEAKVKPIEGKGKTPGQYFADAKTPSFKSSVSLPSSFSITALTAQSSGAREAVQAQRSPGLAISATGAFPIARRIESRDERTYIFDPRRLRAR